MFFLVLPWTVRKFGVFIAQHFVDLSPYGLLDVWEENQVHDAEG